MGVRSTSALWQRQGTSGQPLVSQLTPSWGLSLGGSGQGWTPAKTNHTSRTLTENRTQLKVREKIKFMVFRPFELNP
ncbi:hypothetical protein JOQ06_020751, partial [Pogonophryne albipinna]